ncbi:MAG: methyltransferase domain-containing protein [Chitinophaga sp.]|uniref:class I SAM-dependent methyltransferase n=1 Tax=Chitinophaga sp. TaxID=1869181 RepID=UPI0025C3CAAD|nr:methyltransferase domain-containing protein [Chitinophaga sp.]MBV8253689.1 methyltransferase domain-containing protein [Chitinophaga sp.]
MKITEAQSLIAQAGLPGGTWADLGAGSGLFSAALAQLLPAGSTIYAIDIHPPEKIVYPIPSDIQIIPMQQDFVQQPLSMGGLSGILMANSLHYVADKKSLVRQLKTHMEPTAIFIIVEYETDQANPWVPYPIPFQALTRLMQQVGFGQSIYLGDRPSVFRSGKMYAATFRQ